MSSTSSFTLSSPIPTHFFMLPLDSILTHIATLQHQSFCHPFRIIYLTVCTNYQTFITLQQKIGSPPSCSPLSILAPFISVIPFFSQSQLTQHLKTLQKMQKITLDSQYKQMTKLLEIELQKQLIRKYCQQSKQFKWPVHKIQAFMDREGITSLNEFMRYRGWSQRERKGIEELWEFLGLAGENE